MEKQILLNTEATSQTFSGYTGICQLTITDHAGGTWTLQRQSPVQASHWIDLDVTFAAEGAKVFYASPNTTYRVHGGTAGATGWIIEIPLRTVTEPGYVRSDIQGVSLS